VASSPAVAGLIVSLSSGPRLIERGASTGIYTQSRTSFLVSHWLLWWPRETSSRWVLIFRSRRWYRLRFLP